MRARRRAPRRPPTHRRSSPGGAKEPAPAGLTRAALPPGVAPHLASTRAATPGAAQLTPQRGVAAQRADAPRTAAAAAAGEERREAYVDQPQAGRQPRGSVLGGRQAISQRKLRVGERTRPAAAADAATLALISATIGHAHVVGVELSKHPVEILDRKTTTSLAARRCVQAIIDRDGHRLLVASSVLHRSFKLRKLRPQASERQTQRLLLLLTSAQPLCEALAVPANRLALSNRWAVRSSARFELALQHCPPPKQPIQALFRGDLVTAVIVENTLREQHLPRDGRTEQHSLSQRVVAKHGAPVGVARSCGRSSQRRREARPLDEVMPQRGGRAQQCQPTAALSHARDGFVRARQEDAQYELVRQEKQHACVDTSDW